MKLDLTPPQECRCLPENRQATEGEAGITITCVMCGSYAVLP